MIKRILYAFSLLTLVHILNSTILNSIAIFGILPDLSLILLIYFSSTNGSLEGQITGFSFGLLEDALSLSPLGFHAFIRTVSGHLFGLGKGNIFYDPLLIPTLMVILGTLLKYVLSWILSSVFNLGLGFQQIFHSGLFIEILYNGLLAAVLYYLYSNFLNKKSVQRGTYDV